MPMWRRRRRCLARMQTFASGSDMPPEVLRVVWKWVQRSDRAVAETWAEEHRRLRRDVTVGGYLIPDAFERARETLVTDMGFDAISVDAVMEQCGDDVGRCLEFLL